jgi:hypothetical protein
MRSHICDGTGYAVIVSAHTSRCPVSVIPYQWNAFPEVTGSDLRQTYVSQNGALEVHLIQEKRPFGNWRVSAFLYSLQFRAPLPRFIDTDVCITGTDGRPLDLYRAQQISQYLLKNKERTR